MPEHNSTFSAVPPNRKYDTSNARTRIDALKKVQYQLTQVHHESRNEWYLVQLRAIIQAAEQDLRQET